MDPDVPELHYSIGRALMHLQQPRAAAEAFEEEIERFGGRSVCHFLLGQACLQLKEYERSKASYERAVELQPDLWNAYYGLANVCARLGQTEQARRFRKTFQRLKAEETEVASDRVLSYDDLAVVRKGVARVRSEAGAIHFRLGDPAEAERHWRRAAKLDPDNVPLLLRLAALYQKSRRDREALRAYEKLRELDPRNPAYAINAGTAHARLGEPEAAARAFVRATELAPEQSAGYRCLAQLHLRGDGDLDRARTLARKAVDLEPIAANYIVLAEACDKTGDRPAALAAMRRAVALEPGNPRYQRIYALYQRRN
jgi:tetratricopeptide (TPR) repeat protein